VELLGNEPKKSNGLKRVRYTQADPEDTPYMETNELESAATLTGISRMTVNSGFLRNGVPRRTFKASKKEER
jgi:hypothetical protein